MNTKVHGYFLCYNEDYILPHLLRHYSSFCEKIHILDTNSTDRTNEICAKYPNVEIIQIDTNNSIDDNVFTIVKNNVWKKSRGTADYVIICDADEFLCHKTVPMDKFFDVAKQNGCDIFDTTGYNMVAEENLVLGENDNIFELVTRGKRERNFDKRIVFNPNIEINFIHGCHVSNPYNVKRTCNSSGLIIKHFKYIGLNYYVEKMRLNAQRLSNVNKQHQWGIYVLQDSAYHTKLYKEIYQSSEVI